MKLNWHGSVRPQEQFETWFNQQRQNMVLEGKTAPPSGPCPDEAFLRDLAHKSRKIALSDSRVAHAAACPHCMRKLLLFRSERRSHIRRLVLAAGAASCLLIPATIIWTVRHGPPMSHRGENIAVSAKTLDLSNAGTFRGDQPVPLQSVSLPAALVKVTIVLPRFSTPGRYAIAVTREKTGSGRVADGSAAAASDGNRQVITVTMDLRSAKAGPYFLSTTHEKDEASYYYPLDIR